MKPFDAIDAKSRAKVNLSLNVWDLGNKNSFKRPFMMFFWPYIGEPKFLAH